jgi:DNA (cytosine-5)-methyltransferase 1
MNQKLTVIDFFCGAGGFSEGFRQQGFTIIWGIDKWEPAISTYNHNYELNCEAKDILKLSQDVKEIDRIPNSDVIIGSPPCVSFSNSNKSGKADKSMGVILTEAFLRIVAIKKFQKNSVLKSWYMENVPNSIKHLRMKYSFKDLDLSEWAKENGLDENLTAIKLDGNSFILNSANYGAFQSRNRVITGENIETGEFKCPPKTHDYKIKDAKNLKPYESLSKIKNSIPSPFTKKTSEKIHDPLYPNIEIPQNELTDHFYDSGLYECQWKNSKFMKRNHPFMGKMSFPENEHNPSRTITATNIGTSRESIIYKSEVERSGDGEYRTPTIREMASIMGFPYTYQFKANSINAKARLVGNAVCVSVSRAIAKQLRLELGVPRVIKNKIQLVPRLKNIPNLNTYTTKSFNNPPTKKKGSRFRMHPFKDGNMTVTLSNYNITKKNEPNKKWYTSIQYGNGNGYPSNNYKDYYFEKIEELIYKQKSGKEFLKVINNGFLSKIAKGDKLQELYENYTDQKNFKNPLNLIEEISVIIDRMKVENHTFIQNGIKVFKHKDSVPLKQLFALL